MTIQETCGKEVAGCCRIQYLCYGFGGSFCKLCATSCHRALLARLHHGYFATLSQLVERFTRRLAGECQSLLFISKDNVGMIQEVREKLVLCLDNIVARQVQTNLQTCSMCHLDSTADQVVVLHQVSLDVEVRETFEPLWAKVVGMKCSRCAKECSKRALTIWCDEGRGNACGQFAGQEVGLDAVLFAVVRKEMAVVIFAHTTDDTRRRAEVCQRQYGICSRTAGSALHLHLAEAAAHGFVARSIDQLHRTLGQIHLCQQCFVLHLYQCVYQGISDAQNSIFHVVCIRIFEM